VAFVALVAGGCATEGATDAPSLVAVVPPPSVTVQNVSSVTRVEPPATAPAAPSLPAHVARAPAVGCGSYNTDCLEAACARGDGHSCEACADRYADSGGGPAALEMYRRAFLTYRGACERGDDDGCADYRRMDDPGYTAHGLRHCPDAYVMSEMSPSQTRAWNAVGCIVPDGSSGPTGTTVVVNGNHDVVQVFGSAAKVVGRSSKKTKAE
jgi:hypothetical protein